MITQYLANRIADCYSEIEQAKEMIIEIEKIYNNCSHPKHLELHFPANAVSDAKITKIPLALARSVIDEYIINQETQLRSLEIDCYEQLQIPDKK